MTIRAEAPRATPYTGGPQPPRAVPGDQSTGPHGAWQFRADIEGLRAIAVIAIILYHVGWRFARGGFLGVDVFFVVSGYVIAGVLLAEIDRTGRVSLSRFWARRARRLLPAAGLLTLVVLAMAYAFGPPFELAAHAKTAIAFSAYASNVLFVRRGFEYFSDAAITDPLLHTWSLSVEEQFYLCFAPAMLLLAMWCSRRGIPLRRRLVALSLPVIIGSLALAVATANAFRTVDFYLLPTRVWEFGLGILVAAWRPGASPRHDALAGALAALSASVLVACIVFLDERVGHPGLPTLVPLAATAMLIATGAGAPTIVSRTLSVRPLVRIGALSYSLYLWHWPALVFLQYAHPDATLGTRLAVVIASAVPAAISYRFVESPIRFSRWSRDHAGATLVGAGALAALVILASTASSRANRMRLDAPGIREIVRARAELPASYTDGCHANVPDVAPKLCAYGDRHSATTVVLFGDSHAAQWLTPMIPVARARHWRLISITKSDCPSIAVVAVRGDDAYPECGAWRAASMSKIDSLRPQIVMLSNLSHRKIRSSQGVWDIDSSDVAMSAWRDGLATTIRALERSGARVILLHDTPMPGFDVPSCLIMHRRRPERCNMVAQPTSVRLARAESAAVNAGAVIIDLSASICRTTSCPVARDGLPLFRDENHLSVAGARMLQQPLGAALDSALAIIRTEQSWRPPAVTR